MQHSTLTVPFPDVERWQRPSVIQCLGSRLLYNASPGPEAVILADGLQRFTYQNFHESRNVKSPIIHHNTLVLPMEIWDESDPLHLIVRLPVHTPCLPSTYFVI
jgi:hypothetical protein